MDLGLQGKVFMVSASSKGLGYGIAAALAQEGAVLSIASRTKEDIERAANTLQEQTGIKVLPCVFDAKDNKSIAAWVNETKKRFGTIDGLVVNAGGPKAGKFCDFDDAGWEEAFNLTLLSAVRMIREVLPSFREKKSGAIVTVTSISVKEPITGLILSNVMRAGVSSLVKSLANEFASEGIRVNNLIPGRFDTDRVRSLDEGRAKNLKISLADLKTQEESDIPLGRYGVPLEFGKACAFLLSDAASYITGTSLLVDGGKTSAI